MENATKALIIAAAVMIAILLISLGVGIFNTAQEQVGNYDLSEYEIQQFNDKFIMYQGNSVSGTKVNTMLDMVYNHNLVNEDEAMRVRVTKLKADGKHDKYLIYREWFNDPKYELDYPRVSVGKRYSVKVEIDKTTGLVYNINVTEK